MKFAKVAICSLKMGEKSYMSILFNPVLSSHPNYTCVGNNVVVSLGSRFPRIVIVCTSLSDGYSITEWCNSLKQNGVESYLPHSLTARSLNAASSTSEITSIKGISLYHDYFVISPINHGGDMLSLFHYLPGCRRYSSKDVRSRTSFFITNLLHFPIKTEHMMHRICNSRIGMRFVDWHSIPAWQKSVFILRWRHV